MAKNSDRLHVSWVDFECNYCGSFKVGDNIKYNCTILWKLLESDSNLLFNKPIVLQAASLVEASLQQIIYRAQFFRIEGVPKISPHDRLEIESKRVEKFAVIIDVMKKYRVLDGLHPDIYTDLHQLRRLRNKVHIQANTTTVGASFDEAAIFSDAITVASITTLFGTIQYLVGNFPRPPHCAGHVGTITIPQI